jgi:hypothetical protein
VPIAPISPPTSIPTSFSPPTETGQEDGLGMIEAVDSLRLT